MRGDHTRTTATASAGLSTALRFDHFDHFDYQLPCTVAVMCVCGGYRSARILHLHFCEPTTLSTSAVLVRATASNCQAAGCNSSSGGSSSWSGRSNYSLPAMVVTLQPTIVDAGNGGIAATETPRANLFAS